MRLLGSELRPGGVDHADSAIGHGLRGKEARGAGGDFALDQPEVGNRLAEGVALLGIADHVRQCVARAANAGDAKLEAANVEHIESDVVALAGLAKQVGDGDFAIRKDQRAGGGAVNAQLVLFRADSEAGGVALDKEGGELFSPSHLGEDGVEVGDAAVGDPHLLAVEHVVGAVGRKRGAGTDVHGVGAGAGFESA